MKDAIVDLIQEATQAVRLSSGLDIDLDEQKEIVLRVDDKSIHLSAHARKTIEKIGQLGSIKASLDAAGNRSILVTNYLSPNLAEKCRELDIPFLDAAGNAFLSLPGVRIFVSGRKKGTKSKSLKGNNLTALKVHLAILTHSGLISKPFREIAKTANCSLTAVQRTIQELVDRKIIRPESTHLERILEQPSRLFDDWVANYPISMKPQMKVRRFHCKSSEWWKEVNFVNAWWGGEVAASIMTKHLKPATQTLFVNEADFDSVIKSMANQYRWQADPKGEIEVYSLLQELPRQNQWSQCAPAIMVYADLLASLDSRNMETAKVLFEKVIENELITHP